MDYFQFILNVRIVRLIQSALDAGLQFLFLTKIVRLLLINMLQFFLLYVVRSGIVLILLGLFLVS